MGWYADDSEEHGYCEQALKFNQDDFERSDSSLRVTIIAAAAAYEVSQAYKGLKAKGKCTTYESAKEKLNEIDIDFISREIETEALQDLV